MGQWKVWIGDRVPTRSFRGEGCATKTPRAHVESGMVVDDERRKLLAFPCTWSIT
jgi:hypothetical protein